MLRVSVLLLAALALSAAPVRAQGSARGTAGAPADSAAVTLEPGDAIRVQVYQEPALTGDFLVDEEGIVVLPLIGEQHVTGVPLRELRRRLTAQYQVQLRNPSISIIPLRRIAVYGEVNKPGIYPLDPTVTLAGAIATAGGPTGNGNLNRVWLVRKNGAARERASAQWTLDAVSVRSGDQIIVDRRSWFDRNSTFLVSAVLSVTSIAISILR